ncbi:hypothetical protein LCGC14_0231650 [marine sediment metagenome]|uniref:DNA methylase N-4/N-6 domain-containing protein n=1 Tax=marine sediment metagenome TaxID=412755 RepID=A0A0F9URC3_9ZZZZ
MKRSKLRGSISDLRKTYIRPALNFHTSTTIWPADELISQRTKHWKELTGEDGRSGSRAGAMRKEETAYSGTYSVYPAPLVEWVLLRYGGKEGNRILDPFAGGPVRGVVASIMGYEYHGIDVRQEAITENEKIIEELGLDAHYHLGDGTVLDCLDSELFDLCFACPPYHNLEVYSDQDDDISNLEDYLDFDEAMGQAAVAIKEKLKPDAFTCVNVGNFRDKSKALVDFRGDTVINFHLAGFILWQDIILSRSAGSAAVRAANSWKGMKLVPRHEHLLVFRNRE